MVRKEGETDEGGRFDFTQLPAGQYSVMVAPPSGFVRPERSENVKLADNQSATVTIKLDRTGAITGRVLDESGDPVARVQVRAMRRDTTGGRLMSIGGGSFSSTDDLGHFRLYDLPPGDYYVAGSYSGGYPPSPSGSGPRTGYAPTYYPGSPTSDGARRVTVRSAQDTGGIEFSLQRVPLGRVVGVALDSKGRPLTSGPGVGANVMISPREDGSSSRGSGVRPDGTFVIPDVTPGDYYVSASLTRGQGPDAEREGAYLPVTVNGNDVTVNIQTNTGATLSGRIVVEGSESAAAFPASGMARSMSAPRVTITVRSDPGDPTPMIGYAARPVQVAEDGTFELTGVRGSVFILPMGGRGILKSVFRGGQDVTAPMKLQGTEHVTDLMVVMTTDVATLEGLVTDSQGEPAPGVTVVVFPDDPDRWFTGSPFVFLARTMASVPPVPQQITPAPGRPAATSSMPGSGRFFAPRLLAGRYWVVALAEGATMPALDRAALEKLRPLATSVTLTAGRPTTVQLRIAR
jgi:hypothetical protein